MHVRAAVYAAIVILVLSISPTKVNALTFEGSAVASWTNPNATFGFTITNSDIGGIASVDWGTPGSTPFNNRFTINGIGSDGPPNWSTSFESPFKIGDFTYRNGSVFSDSHNFHGIDLTILLSIVGPLTLTQPFTFGFDAVNTPNDTGDPVLDADIVTVVKHITTARFSFMGTDYTLELLGFSSNGGTAIRTEFRSPEGTTATADLFARITTAVPQPSSFVLLALASGSIGAIQLWRRRVNRKLSSRMRQSASEICESSS